MTNWDFFDFIEIVNIWKLSFWKLSKFERNHESLNFLFSEIRVFLMKN